MQPDPTVNVLLVDDHPENLIALEAMLEGLHQNLVKAYSGEDALRRLLHQDFAVILLDVQMPGLDGFETATLIRERDRSRHTPIIFLTAFGNNEALRFKGYSLGAVDYLQKPIEPEILTSKVSVFVDLFKKTEEVKRQAAQLSAMNAELAKTEKRFRSLSACSPVGIFLTDMEGKCTYTNPRCQSICDLSAEEMVGQGWLKAVHPEDLELAVAQWQHYTRQGQNIWQNTEGQFEQKYECEFRLLTPAGRSRWAYIRSSPMVADTGEILGHVGTIEDITERKLAEEARAQIIREQAARQEAEAANRMKDEFLAVLSHELRTPLNSIMGWSQLLRRFFQEALHQGRNLDESLLTRALETIDRNAKSQAQLIEDILDVSRLMQGKLQINPHLINPLSIIESAIRIVTPMAEAKGLKIIANLTDVGWICGDGERLQQVMWNLLSNAIKFSHSAVSGEGDSTLNTILVRLQRQGDWAEIQVQDHGVGIRSNFLPHVFDRFRQADSTTTRTHGGLGLGLAIVHHLVELHQGSIQAESEGENQGATFTLRLPLANPVLLNGWQGLPSLSQLQVLVIEKDPDTRLFLCNTLAQSGAKVTAVSSILEALRVWDAQPPDVLVSDVCLANTDSEELIRKVQDCQQQKGRAIPAIALSTCLAVDDCHQHSLNSFQKHLSKPFQPQELITTVAQLTQRTRRHTTLPGQSGRLSKRIL